jgi:hypothetical protein
VDGLPNTELMAASGVLPSLSLRGVCASPRSFGVGNDFFADPWRFNDFTRLFAGFDDGFPDGEEKLTVE